MTISDRMQARMNALRIPSASELSRRSLVPQPTCYRILSGKTANPDSDTLAKLAAALSVSPDWLLTGRGVEATLSNKRLNVASPPFDRNVGPAEIGRRKIPVISYVQAGRMTEVQTPFSVGDVFEYLLTDLDLSSRAFALEIRGKSMEPEFREGDHAIFEPAMHARAGDFVVAKNGSEEATFKKYRPRGTSSAGQEIFELAPLNDDFATLRSDIEQLTIIAVLVEYRRYLRRKS